MIQVSNLSKSYGPKIAVADITFDVQPGEILGFLGPNGAGKTTTMRILSGYMPASGGSAIVAGHDVFSESIEVRRNVGYLPETVPLYLEMSVQGYLTYMAAIRGVARQDRRERVDSVMRLCHVDDVRRTQIGKISKGFRQRVGIAQALVHDPPVLILDEPTVGLDPKQITDTRQLIKSLGGTHTVILSTHILPEVSMTCSRVVIISDGRVVAEDTTENLTRRLRGAERIALEVRGPLDLICDTLGQLPNVLHAEGTASDGCAHISVDCAVDFDLREEIAARIVHSGWGLLELRPVSMSLEEVFLKLTTREDEAEQ